MFACIFLHSLSIQLIIYTLSNSPNHYTDTHSLHSLSFTLSQSPAHYLSHSLSPLKFTPSFSIHPPPPPPTQQGKTTEVLELSTESFNATVKIPPSLGNNVLHIVEFYSDRCPYCKILSPEIIEASLTLQKEEPRVVISACNTRIYYEVSV